MKIEELKNLDMENVVGDFESTTSTITDSSMSFIMDLLSKALYSNPIGSIIREITSNCFDSHVEAKVNDAVVISKGYDEEGTYITFKDIGVGLSPFRIKNIYINYGSSTKRESNNEIGGFGLGSKSPLSYTDAFEITTISDKIEFEILEGVKAPYIAKKVLKTIKSIRYEYTYIFSKGKSRPTLDLLTKKQTDKRNGTEIKIPIKSNDVFKFEQELKSQLCYFDNVYFKGWGVENVYKIYEGKYYKFKSTNQYSDEMHIILGKVAYPIDWYILGIDRIDISVGVKFEIGELLVTPNRENLRYEDHIIKLVRDRVLLAFEELKDLYKEQNNPYENYIDWYLNKNKRACITFGDKSSLYPDTLYLNDVKGLDKKIRYTGFKELPYFYDFDLVPRLYQFSFAISDGKILDRNNKNFVNYLIDYRNQKYLLFCNNKASIAGAKNFYWKSKICITKTLSRLPKQVFINKYKKAKGEKDIESYNIKFGNGKHYFLLGQYKKIYQTIKQVRSELELGILHYDNIPKEAYKQYTEFNKANNASLQRKLNGKVFVKDLYSFTDREISVKEIENFNGIIVYGNRDDKFKLDKAKNFLKQIKTIPNKYARVFLISKQNEKYFKNKDNMVNVNNFYSDHKLFRRMASCYKIEQFFDSCSNEDEFANKINEICSQVGVLLTDLIKYKDKYITSRLNPDLKNEILEIANKNNLFDPVIEGIFDKVNLWFKGVEVLRYTTIDDNSLPYILKYLKENKKKLNYEYYCKYVLPKPELKFKQEEEGQIIMLFPEQEEQLNEEVTKFKYITDKQA